MARNVAALLLLFAYGSCMEMRETVERMVMVRTTGSDLQPAATGYIYKKESDSPASVIEMGESEVIEHFSKLRAKPEAYKAPLPASAGPLYAKEQDDDKAATQTSEEHVKPVVETTDEHDDRIDGIAAENYDKIFEDYAKRYGSGYKNDFADYLHGLGHYDHGIYHDFEADKDYGSKGYHGYGHKGVGVTNHYEKGAAGDYHTAKHEGYKVSKEEGHKRNYGQADDQGTHYDHGFKGVGIAHHAGHDKGEAADGFHKLYDTKDYKEDQDFFDGDSFKGGHHKYPDGHVHYGSAERRNEKGGVLVSGHHDNEYGKGEYEDKDSADEHDGEHSSNQSAESKPHGDDFGIKSEAFAGKGYGFKIKH